MPSPTISLLDRLAPYGVHHNYWATPHQIMDAVRSAIFKWAGPRPRHCHPRYPLFENSCSFMLHKAVRFLCANGVRPHNAHLLALEWPHQAESDRGKVAYTRQEADATRVQLPPDHPRHSYDQKYTVTSLTKYIKRHWPQLPDHIVRDLDARFNPAVKCQIETDYRRMICIMNAGPRSCMTTEYGSIPFESRHNNMAQAWFNDQDCAEPDWDRHPYTVYRHALGWSMAYRTENDGTQTKISARALVYSGPATSTPCFVRSYGDGGRDSMLEQWLEGQGIEHRNSWPDGAEILMVGSPCGEYMMPYIDGDTQKADMGNEVFIITWDGEYDANNTSGVTSEPEPDWTCDDCGRGFYDDNESSTTVSMHEEHVVCDSCLHDNYTWVRGSSRWGNYREYYAPSDDAITVLDNDGDTTDLYVDQENLPDGYVMTENRRGSTCAIRIEDACVIDGDYWPIDETDVVELNEEAPNGDQYAWEADAWKDGDGQWHQDGHEHIVYDGEKWLKDDAWQCEATGWWYPEHVDQEIDPVTGDTVHADYLEGCNRDADFIIVYGDEPYAACGHVSVPRDSALVFDACTSEVFALVD